jgi:hypothetical protein
MRAVRCVLRAERVHSPCLTIARAAPGSGAGRNPDGLLLGSRVVPQDEVRIRRGPTKGAYPLKARTHWNAPTWNAPTWNAPTRTAPPPMHPGLVAILTDCCSHQARTYRTAPTPMHPGLVAILTDCCSHQARTYRTAPTPMHPGLVPAPPIRSG